ncbi:NYN domain-containing protein [Devosia sp. XJ19-1]|uniref:NYN domain-containing protein n=1 Tax=Devosia ureilytica TaxID=2952754 RepID=A0A9Q4APU3_9HYPH|nr:NYN domain-containing protein [Devosia ureilytica]MCP8888133.1 NYN domain-containing protein [Devosia ureilytica]
MVSPALAGAADAEKGKPVWDKTRRWLNNFNRKRIAVPEIAVFVDCDGISAADAERALKIVKQYGHIRLLRVYGNHAGRSVHAWASLVSRNNGEARHLPTLKPGKNANDIALSIDAVEVVLTGRIDIFAIVASDTDFVPLVRRLLQEGKTVLGFGQRSTPQALRSECSMFWDLESSKTFAVARRAGNKLWTLSPLDAEALVVGVLREIAPDGELIALGRLSKLLKRREPDFDSRVYSRRNISGLIRHMQLVELVDLDGVPNVRLRAPQD